MNIRTCAFFTCLLLIGCHIGTAQPLDGRLAASRYEIHSNVLNETRAYWVAVPDDYNEQAAQSNQYPVIYVLDGEKYFPAVAGILDFLANGNRGRFPKCIVVGIVNSDRTRDFTPTPAISAKGSATLANSGGGSQFARFLTTELIPAVAENWRTAIRRIIIGHSFGGLEAAYILLRHPGCFTDYLLVDPSFWWDDFELLDYAAQEIAATQNPGAMARVFVGFSGNEAKSPYLTPERNLTAILHREPDAWRSQTSWYPTETHGSIFVPALYDGLRAIFQEGN